MKIMGGVDVETHVFLVLPLVDVSRQLHSPATLLPRKEATVSTGYGAGGHKGQSGWHGEVNCWQWLLGMLPLGIQVAILWILLPDSLYQWDLWIQSIPNTLLGVQWLYQRGNNFIQFNYIMKNTVFLDVTPCGSCKSRHFGGMWRGS
jgi:hypothetical protein